MLVLTRKSNQSIMIGDDIEIAVLSTSGEKVRLGISAGKEVPIYREEVYERIKAYAPYENVTAQNYPATLVIAGYNDSRVQYWEAAKWVAKLRATKTDDNLLLLKINMGAGHGGKSGRYDSLKEDAEAYAFVLTQVGERGSS